MANPKLSCVFVVGWQQKHPSNWTSQEVMDFIHFIAQESTPEDVIPDFSGHMFNNLSGSDLIAMTAGDFEARSPEFGRQFFEYFKHLTEKCKYRKEFVSNTKFNKLRFNSSLYFYFFYSCLYL